MKTKFEPIIKNMNGLLHGADYNPDQWRNMKEIWDEDMRLMQLAKTNVMSVGIFSWGSIEVEENVYDFSWLDTIMDKLNAIGTHVFLATPSGARPAWMAQKYPEVLRVAENRHRELYRERHNHCFSSPYYRMKVAQINEKLAIRYKDHPALALWHISNEYGGECHCDLCQENFRKWLRKKYNNDIKQLNSQWFTYFWSHEYTDFSQIESPGPHGIKCIHALYLDWKRFVTDQTIDFYLNEIKPLKEITPNIPVTTNFMWTFEGLDYSKFAKHLDVVSWDSYPRWRGLESDQNIAMQAAFNHDMFRSLKSGKPFLLMESTPSLVNWTDVNTLKRPNQHLLSSLQAIAHGSDSVQYFQWRKGRGGSEKFHGAVVDHCGHENTRVFTEVKLVGEALIKLKDVGATAVESQVAIIFDTENRWALKQMQGLRNDKKDYIDVCKDHYNAFWKANVAIDVISMDADFSKYKIISAPMLYMLKPNVAERIEEFVKNGGIFITTYFSGIVNENDLCFLGGFPGPLRKVLGIWMEEIDTLEEGIKNKVEYNGKQYNAKDYCELSHLETAEKLAIYATDFYKDMPAVTVNKFGKGFAYYVAFKAEEDFLWDFYSLLLKESLLNNPLEVKIPSGVRVSVRTDYKDQYIFIMNNTPNKISFPLNDNKYYEMLEGKDVNEVNLEGFGVMVLKRDYIKH